MLLRSNIEGVLCDQFSTVHKMIAQKRENFVSVILQYFKPATLSARESIMLQQQSEMQQFEV